jgi:uncharacterized protein YndB with AHSA1/START domain
VPSFVTEQTIERSALEVWTYATDIARHPEWMTVTDASVIRGHGTEPGARGRERMRFGPFAWDVEFEVVVAEPGRRIVWEAVGGAPFDLRVALDLEPIAPGRTRATYGADIKLHGKWRLLGPIVAMEGKAGPDRELRRLKERIEGGLRPAVALS